MRVDDLLRRKGNNIVSVRPGTSLKDTMSLMAKAHVGTALLMDEAGTLQGIISERDFVRIFTDHGAEALDLAVCDLVQRDVITCRGMSTLHDCITTMSNNSIRHLPVMQNGKVAGMISARDVLDAQKAVLMRLVKRQKQALSFAMQAKTMAEESDHHKTEFLHRISHELRTPLNAIIGFSSILESESMGPLGVPEYKEYSADIATSGKKLLGIIDEILEMSRLELGACDQSDDAVNIAREAANCLDRFRPQASGKKQTISVLPINKPAIIVADRTMVRKMLGHLVSNAVKFTPNGGDIQVEVSIGSQGDLLVEVRDTGPGIPEDQIDWITKPFGCVEAALTQSSQGAGLGLALTTAMIALHEGKLEIANRSGGGTVVSLHFPSDRRQIETPSERLIA